jgi:DNA-binding MarR family transcriptional regulator
MNHELEEEAGLPLSWYDVLLHLYHAPDQRLRMSDLVERMVFSPSGLSRRIDRMADAGLVRREQCPSDRRSYFATLTDEGKARLRAASPIHLRGIQEHFGGHLSNEEADALAGALRRVADDLLQR